MQNIIALHGYGGQAAKLARRVKDAFDEEARGIIAAEMALHVPRGGIIVPAPSSSGTNPAILWLAHEVARLAEARALEAVMRIVPVPSSQILRRWGLPIPTVEEHIASMARAREADQIPDNWGVFLLDNVLTSGHTLRAVQTVLGLPDERATWLVYARVGRGRHNPEEETPRRFCFCGSRGCRDADAIERVLVTLPPGATIVHGGARGADTLAGSLAARHGFTVEVWPADWSRHGRAAGPIRNEAMVRTCDGLFAFWDGTSRGTAHAVRTGRALGLEVQVFPPWRNHE